MSRTKEATITKSTIGLFSDRMHPIFRMGISEASDEGHFVHFVNSVRSFNVRLLAGETRVSTFHDEEVAFRFVVESLDRVCVAGADRAGENAVNRQVPCGRRQENACYSTTRSNRRHEERRSQHQTI